MNTLIFDFAKNRNFSRHLVAGFFERHPKSSGTNDLPYFFEIIPRNAHQKSGTPN